jgi:hypothetical protein
VRRDGVGWRRTQNRGQNRERTGSETGRITTAKGAGATRTDLAAAAAEEVSEYATSLRELS